MKKIIVFFTIALLIFPGLVLAQEKTLEVDYPGLDISETKNLFPEYVKYVFTFIITALGGVLFWYLITGGITYITAGGDPEKMKEAKKKITSVFWGAIILLSSFLILRTINPQILAPTSLEKLEDISLEPEEIPSPESKAPDILGKIEEIVQIVQLIAPATENRAQALADQTSKCQCSLLESVCVCKGGSEGDPCEAKSCYSKGISQPCPDGTKIKDNQQKIIAFRDEFLYYKNRSLSEKKDLSLQADRLASNISYYQKKIDDETNKRAIAYLKERKEKLEQEKRLKEDLATRLQELADLIENDSQGGIAPPSSEISNLVDKCEYDPEGNYGIENKCQPQCMTGQNYGCHDKVLGCQPTNCSGGNPCPINKIKDAASEISQIKPSLLQTCKEIKDIIREIIEVKTIIVP